MIGLEWQGSERTKLKDPMSIGEIMEEMMRKYDERVRGEAA